MTTSSRNWRKLATNIARITISIGLIGYLLTSVDLRALTDSIGEANLWVLLATILLVWISWSVAAARWYMLLRASGWPISLLESWVITQSARFYGFLTPGQIGSEVVRWARLSAKDRGNAVDVGLSLIFDRLTGFVALVMFAMVAMLNYPSALITPVSRLAIGGLLVGMLAFMVVIVAQVERMLPPRLVYRWEELAASVTSRSRPLKQIIDAIGVYRGKFVAILLALALSIIYHVLNIFVNQLVATSLNLQLSFLQMTMLYAAATVLVMLPVSIAGIGVREMTYAQALIDMGFGGPAIVAMPLLVFGITAVATILLGGLLELLDAFRQLLSGKSESLG